VLFLDDVIRPCRVELKPFALIGDSKEQDEPKSAGEYVVNNSVKCLYCEFVCKSNLSMDSHLRSVHKCLRKCNECKIYFRRLVELEKHLDEVHAETPSKCMYCEEVLNRKNSRLRKHVKECHSNVTIWCCSNGNCSSQFFTEHERNKHFSRAHQNNSKIIYSCIYDNCKMSFKFTSQLIIHFKNEHNGIYFRCDYKKKCASYFTNKEEMVKHIKNIHETFPAHANKRINCLYCHRMVFVTQIPNHTEEYHKDKKHFRCRYSFCFTYFKSQQEQQEHDAQVHSLKGKGAKKCHLCQMIVPHCNMRRHLRVKHKNESINFCKYMCGYFGSMDELNKHYTESHESETNRMKCVYCGLFYIKEAILMHVKCKHKSQAIKCTYPCRTYFLSLADRNKHIVKVHSKAPIIGDNICIYCKKGLSSKDTLRQHVLAVHKQLFIKCSLRGCGKYFLSQSDLGKHFLENHQENEDVKLLKCLKCNYKTNRKFSLNQHIERKHGTVKVTCPKCSNVFKSKILLNAHLDSVHQHKRMKCNHCKQDVLNLRLHQRWTKCTQCQKVTPCIFQTREHVRMCNVKK
jgi:hypothetical protein